MPTKKLKSRKGGYSRALTIVNKFFPKVMVVKDATDDLTVEVTKRDNESSEVKSHKSCAMAVACKRKMKADGMIVSIRTAYVVKGDTATRYVVPASVQREIVAFDRGGKFAEGSYELKAVPEYLQIGTKRDDTRESTGPSRASQVKHFTEGIRAIIGGGRKGTRLLEAGTA